MILERLTRMGITELSCRGRQEASKWLDRVRSAGKTNGARGRKGDLQEAERMLMEDFFYTGPGRFFNGVVNEQAAAFLTSEARDGTLAAADALLKRRFNLLGYRGLFFGVPIDWQMDPVSGRRAPLVHWSRLDPLDAEAVGDSKVIWELNRHQWLISLGQAYRLTGDERYGEMFAGCVRDWMRANPPGMGINWASSLEVSLRLISWCWAVFLFRGSKFLSQELFSEMLEGVGVHASHIEKYLSYYFAPNTHLTGEALGLFYAGVVFPELKPRRRELGMRILMEQLTRQVMPDGVYFEQSICYQRYTVEIYLHFLILAERNGVTVPPTVRERIERMLDFLLAVRHPNGSMPQIGDADGGWLLPLVHRDPNDVRGIFSTAAALWGRPDYAWAAGGLAPETLWLLGPEGQKAYESLRPAPPATLPSRIFSHGGYAVMRSGWEADAHHLIFDAGPLSDPVVSGHGHADLLSLQCSVFGEPCLLDPGTYGYTAEPDWRDHFRGTAAHSTVMVDGEGQSSPAGPFGWETRPRTRLRQWITTKAFDFADADHDAYRCLPDPVTHRRRVLFVKPHYWVVVDDLNGAGEHRVELRFQFAPMKVTVDSCLWARAQGSNKHSLLIRPFATVPLKADVFEGERVPIQGWVSTNYGQRQPAPVLTYETTAQLPLRTVTLLIPIEDPFASPPAVSLSIGKGTEPVCLLFQDMQETIVMNEHDIILEHR